MFFSQESRAGASTAHYHTLQGVLMNANAKGDYTPPLAGPLFFLLCQSLSSTICTNMVIADNHSITCRA